MAFSRSTFELLRLKYSFLPRLKKQPRLNKFQRIWRPSWALRGKRVLWSHKKRAVPGHGKIGGPEGLKGKSEVIVEQDISSTSGLQYSNELFNYTRNRFVACNEDHKIAQHHRKFNVEALARIAADSIGAAECVSVQKYPDGKFNRALLFTMNDGVQVIAKIPNPNAGMPHFTIASEVATMEFVREVFGIPVPKVYTWSSRTEDDPVGAEYIIMEKAEGVLLEEIWPKMDIQDQLAVIRTIVKYQDQWSSISFHKFGSIYYTNDLSGDIAAEPGPLYTNKEGFQISSTKFAVGPSTGRDYIDDGRLSISFDRGPWNNLEDYHRAIGNREVACTKNMVGLPTPKMILTGPGTYQPSRKKKLKAIDCYLKLLKHLLPNDRTIARSVLWHSDLHEGNVFVNPSNPSEVVGLIDWQNIELMPLYNHIRQPSLINLDSHVHLGLDDSELHEIYSEFGPEDQKAAGHLLAKKDLSRHYGSILHEQYPLLYRALKFQETDAYKLLSSARDLLVDGEPIYLSQVAKLEKRSSLPGIVEKENFPFKFSHKEKNAIDADVESWSHGSALMKDTQELLGDSFPKSGVVKKENYEDALVSFAYVLERIIDRYATNEEEKEIWRQKFPFKCKEPTLLWASQWKPLPARDRSSQRSRRGSAKTSRTGDATTNSSSRPQSR